MHTIQWYPGHMTKARRMMADQCKLIDVVVEIVDARAPKATRNPDFDDLFANKRRAIILNKSDLADQETTAEWIRHFRSEGWFAMDFVATKKDQSKKAKALIEAAVKEKVDELAKKGIKKTVRAMIAGIPNVGKSTFINCLSGAVTASTGNRPGVTKGKQWVRISQFLELMDTPGMLWPKLDDPAGAKRLAWLGSIRDEILDSEQLAADLISELFLICPDKILSRYKALKLDMSGEALIEAVCASRGFLISGGGFDIERGANVVLDEFRSGKIGRISLESPALSQNADDADESCDNQKNPNKNPEEFDG